MSKYFILTIAILHIALLSAIAEQEPTPKTKRSGTHKTSKELMWDASRPEEKIQRYNVYEKIVDRKQRVTWKKIGTVEQPRYTIRHLGHGTHIYAVTAVGPLGESQRSAELVVEN